MQQLHILPLADRKSLHLSGGERRRVALARTLIRIPKLLLLDEPFADLDESGMQAVVEILQSLSETTILITSPGRIPESLKTDGHFMLE
jgi:ABC-type Mn2+/Zn2+ transport system ATPase subunit